MRQASSFEMMKKEMQINKRITEVIIVLYDGNISIKNDKIEQVNYFQSLELINNTNDQEPAIELEKV